MRCAAMNHICSPAGMVLYPRIGKYFDLKTWTNCRMGMMGWAVIILCYAAKQKQAHGAVADSLLVSVALMQIYIAKFFLCDRCSGPCSAPSRCRLLPQAPAALVHILLPCDGSAATSRLRSCHPSAPHIFRSYRGQ